MSAPDSGVYLLFVGSEPDQGQDGAAVSSRFHRLRGFLQLAPDRPDWGPLPGEVRWRVPPDQGRCVRLVLTLMSSTGDRIRLVDVHQRTADPAAIDRWKAGPGLLPCLLAPDGRRLEGLSAFVPATLKRFLRTHPQRS